VKQGQVLAKLDSEEQVIAQGQAQVALNSALEKSSLYHNIKSSVSRMDVFDSEIAEQNARLQEAMASLEPVGGATSLPRDAPANVLDGLKRTFDPDDGGFGGAPKFPHPVELAFALHEWARNGDAEALAIARTSLARMADGGIHDQLAGGFCRYSVDAQWSIPHFEKMLYDNGPLLGLYADLARATGVRAFADVAQGIVNWLVREMRPRGRCSVERVAHHLGVDRRTVHRHLARSGETFSSLVDDVRAELTESYLEGNKGRLTDVADLLGFSELSAFSRWHKRHFGFTLTERRGK